MSAHQRFTLKKALVGSPLAANLLGTIARILPRRGVDAVAPWRRGYFRGFRSNSNTCSKLWACSTRAVRYRSQLSSMNRSGEETSPLVSSIWPFFA